VVTDISPAAASAVVAKRFTFRDNLFPDR
jgi:hypothetical protein